jgi:hypothetical protein
MRSFKQFLADEEVDSCFLTFVMQFSKLYNSPEDSEAERIVREAFEPVFSKYHIEKMIPSKVNKLGGFYSIVLVIAEGAHLNVKDLVNELTLLYKEKIGSYSVFEPNPWAASLYVNLPTSSVFDCDFEAFITRVNNKTAKNIHKTLLNLEHLMFQDSLFNGPVLGTMLMPHLKSVGLEFHLEPPDWIKIINAQLKGDRDLLECKTQLIEAGYAEMAKI